MNDPKRLAQACYRWKQTDDLLAVTFKDPRLSLVKYVKMAVDESYKNIGRPYDFVDRCIKIVEARDRWLRDRILTLARKDVSNEQRQMEFDFG